MGGGRKNQKEVGKMKKWTLERRDYIWIVKPYWAKFMPFIYPVRVIEFWLSRKEYPITPYRERNGKLTPSYSVGFRTWDGWLVKIARAIGSLVERATAKKAIRKPDPEDIPF